MEQIESLAWQWSSASLLLLALMGAGALITANLLWQNLVWVVTGVTPKFSDCLRGFGWLVIGKYLPGKLVGLVGRGSLLPDQVSGTERVGLVGGEQLFAIWGLALVSVVAAIAAGSSVSRETLAVALIGLLVAPLMAHFGGRFSDGGDASWKRGLIVLRFRWKSWWFAALLAVFVLAPAAILPDLLNMSVPLQSRLAIVGVYGFAVLAGMLLFVFPAVLAFVSPLSFSLVRPFFRSMPRSHSLSPFVFGVSFSTFPPV